MESSQFRLIPPARLIVDNRIGHIENQRVEADFDAIGRRLVSDMISDGVLRPDFRVLDVGCGLGRLARVLTEFLSPNGSYHGLDVTRSSIEWCQSNYAQFTNFSFSHADVFSTTYNANARYVPENYRFPFDDAQFDLIYSTSLFTHMRMSGIDNYLAEMRRVLKPGGVLWNTFFLLDQITLPVVTKFDDRKSEIYMPTIIDGGRIAVEHDPEALIGQYEYRIKELHIKNELKVRDILHGGWRGTRPEVRAFYQDVVIAEK